MVGLNGLEPSTSRLSGVRSNQLSYRPLQGYMKFTKEPSKLNAKHQCVNPWFTFRNDP